MLEGEVYTEQGLRNYCLEQLDRADIPTWRKDTCAFIALFTDPEGAAILQQSSGTTGDPKSFSLSRDAMLNSARRTLDFFGLREGERALLCLPVHYIAGKMMVVRALLGGLDLVLAEPSSRPLTNVSGPMAFSAMVPLQVEESLLMGDQLERISRLLIGGAELNPATRKRLAAMETPEAYETFGMTETYTHFALRHINGPGRDPRFQLLKDVNIHTDKRGCLEVEVPGVTPGRVRTNDLVEIGARGDGFTWLGRYDNLINSGGVKIIPELLEARIAGCLGHDCLVLPEPDRKLGSRLVLMVEYEAEVPPDSWLEMLRESLSAYEVPKRIVCVKALPRNPSMKPDRTSALGLLL